MMYPPGAAVWWAAMAGGYLRKHLASVPDWQGVCAGKRVRSLAATEAPALVFATEV